MFEKTLTDVVKGIRASKRDTGLYISQCIAETKNELKSSDPFVKANALQKLTFLQMMGYDMSWASFACVEVMSSQRFAHKRIGYLAGCQGFTEADTDIILLTTNLLKKELRGASTIGMNGSYEAGLAINFLANVVTEDLARELLPEVTALTQHPHPYLRKKAVLCLFKVFVKYPQGLRLAFDRVQQCLSDADPAVVSCAVNVITELSTHNPKNYLLMAPQFFQLLTTSSNNWMLIKVVKLLGSLVSEEPRLARKLLEPLARMVRNTQAKSLLFESVYTITLALPYCRKADGTMPPIVPEIVELCSRTLKTFVQETDQNLKYLGLVGFGSLMVSHPQVLSTREHKDLILQCLSDDDVTLRTRALELLTGMATRKNIVELITQLLRHVDAAGEGPYQVELVGKIIYICRQDKYALLSDFGWYLTRVLVHLAYIQSIEEAHGELIRSQIVEVALRVLPVRKLAVRSVVNMLLDERELRKSQLSNATCGKNRGVMKSVLPAAAWIVGEYSRLLTDLLNEDDEVDNDEEHEALSLKALADRSGAHGPYHAILKALLSPDLSSELAPSTQAVYVQSAMKVFAAACCHSDATAADLEGCVSTLHESLPYFIESTDAEVQERSLSFLKLLHEMGLISLDHSFSQSLPRLTSKGPKKTKKLLETEHFAETNSDDESGDNSEDEGVDNIGGTPPLTSDLLSLELAGPSGSISVDKTTGRPLGPLLSQHNFVASERKKAVNGSFTGGVAEKCRAISKQLSSILIPELMKPISAKAQKRLEPPPGLDLESVVDLSLFDSLITIDNTTALCIDSAAVSIEEVSFTQQRRVPLQSSMEQHGDSAVSGTRSSPVVGVSSSSLDIFEGDTGVKQSYDNRYNAKTPFYLPSGPADAGPLTEHQQQQQQATALSSRFGAIHLLDDDGSNHEVHGKKKKKRKDKDGKSSKGSKRMSEADLAIFSSVGGASTSEPTKYTVYRSDDEDEEEDNDLINRSHKQTSKKKTGKEFESLARVDLTTPLGEEEVMPVRTHRQVPDTAGVNGGHKADKHRKKKSKSDKKEEKKKEGISSEATSGDLLDFSLFESIPNVGQSNSDSKRTTVQSAFDAMSNDLLLPLDTAVAQPSTKASSDLLTMTAATTSSRASDPFSSERQATIMQPSSTSSKRPWLKATIKTDSRGSTSEMHFGFVSLYYKVYTSKGKPPAASISVRLSNNGNLSLRDMSLSFPGMSEEVRIGDLASGETIDSPSKIGPFSYEDASGESSRDIKGYMSASDCGRASFKIVLPCSMLLRPCRDLSHDRVMEELSAGEWSSHSIKLDVANMATQNVIPVLCSFLKAEVVGGADNASNAATLASESMQRTHVRALVKVREGSVKIDLKCSGGNSGLGKSLSSDLKKLLL